MKIYIGADHRGYQDKQGLVQWLQSLGHEVVDEGDEQLNPEDDFPIYAAKVVKQLLADNSNDSRGILICGSGQGMCMAANRYKGIRASICWDEDEARSSRHDDNANVLCVSSDRQSLESVQQIISVWLNTDFANEPRFVRRLQELDNLN